MFFKETFFFPPYRMAFTCSFCKFRTFEEKDIELHLESSSHQETLDHIQKQTKFDKVVMEFLHVSSWFWSEKHFICHFNFLKISPELDVNYSFVI